MKIGCGKRDKRRSWFGLRGLVAIIAVVGMGWVVRTVLRRKRWSSGTGSASTGNGLLLEQPSAQLRSTPSGQTSATPEKAPEPMGPELLTSAPADAAESWSDRAGSSETSAEAETGPNNDVAPASAETPPDVESWSAELAGQASDESSEGAELATGNAEPSVAGSNGSQEESPATVPAGEDETGTFRPERAEPDDFGVVVTDTEPAGLASSSGWLRGDGGNACPASHPIKGNATSRIYHRPGESSYDATIPELCFATEEDAAAAGYRPRAR